MALRRHHRGARRRRRAGAEERPGADQARGPALGQLPARAGPGAGVRAGHRVKRESIKSERVL